MLLQVILSSSNIVAPCNCALDQPITGFVSVAPFLYKLRVEKPSV
eukprot:SAG11_NODE_19505_length_465_cov_1.071038_1_plen_44_part_10